MKLSALFQSFSDSLGQPVVLIPGRGNGNTLIEGFTLESSLNVSGGGLLQVVAFAFMDTAQPIQPFKPFGGISRRHQPDGQVVIGGHLAADILES